MQWKWLKKVKDVYSWYSFASGIAGLTGLSLIVSPVVALVVGVVGATIKGVPWPITVMAGFCTLVAVLYLIALPIFIKSAMQATQTIQAIRAQQLVSEPNKTPEPIKPNYDAWKLVDKFTVRKAACLLENLEPTTNLHDPKIEPWIAALCAEIRKEDLKFILNTEGIDPYTLQDDWEYWETKQQKENPTSSTEISRAALIDFAKRHNIDLKYLGQ
jgi:hypothetical protein